MPPAPIHGVVMWRLEKKTVEIKAIKLVRKGSYAVVEIETATGWIEVIREWADAPYSHIVEESGMQRCAMQSDRATTDQVVQQVYGRLST
jgi:hypothetical protein